MSRSAALRTTISFLSRIAVAVAFFTLISMPRLNAQQTNNRDQDKHLDIRSSAGDLHLGNDADARDTGLPAYPGARLRHDDQDKDGKNSANLAISTGSFGMKLVVVNYDSDDSPNQLITYYRDKLKRYGKVVECHTAEHGGDFHVNAGKNNANGSKDVKCEGDDTGDVVELKVGTQDNQHLVSIEPSGNGSTFALVYVHTRGKQGDI